MPLPKDPLAPPVDYDLLLKLESEGVREQWFEKAAAPYNVSDLLNGVDERRFDVLLSYNTKDAVRRAQAITSARKLLTNRSYGVSYHLCSGVEKG